ncbi:MAG TPA: rhomboid family intramembrane serine protease, partial [Thermofilum sp.]|nr:rhomboid family intramembrane serine protease [Thermofilum sp.]
MTVLLMIANVVIYLLTTYDKAFTSISDYWVSNAALIPVILLEPSEWYRFLTSMFLHGDIFHIFFNMYFLYLFGKEIEDVLGPG